LPEGEAVLTTGGMLPARHVIHTVGPIWHGGGHGEPETLARCYRNSLALAREHGLRSVAFPSISTGAFGYPIEKAAPVALAAIRDFLAADEVVRLVRCVLFSRDDLAAYEQALSALPGVDPA
jgi:O-acetyl-ADP-ribose deacetylase (regulator of RNase III)